MVDPALGFVVGLAASVVGAILLHRAWKDAPRLAPVKPAARVQPAQPGPVGELAAIAQTRGVAAFRDLVEQEARAQLAAAQAEGRAGPMPPILARLATPGAEDDWARSEALAGYRGPRWLFPLWSRAARLTQSREGRTIRYLDALTKALQETVKP